MSRSISIKRREPRFKSSFREKFPPSDEKAFACRQGVDAHTKFIISHDGRNTRSVSP
jgi:hypothetical protein